MLRTPLDRNEPAVTEYQAPQPPALPSDVIAAQLQEFCKAHRIGRLTCVFSVAIADSIVLRLLALPEMVSIVLAAEPEDLPGIDHERIGWLRADGRIGRFPAIVGTTFVKFGAAEAFGYQLARLSLAQGGERIAFDTPIGFTSPRPLWSVLAANAKRGVERALHRRLQGKIVSGRPQKASPFEYFHQKRFRHLIQTAPSARHHAPCVAGRIVFVTGSLGPGGAERQLVNTLLGLAASGRQDMHLLSERLSPAPNDFYLPKLQDCRDLSVVELGAMYEHSKMSPALVRQLTKAMSPAFCADVIRLILIFKRLRPEVVHAWQDGPSAKAGLAALLVGVERIVLSWRSLAPIETALYNPYYAPIFKELATCGNVTMLNNSAAGARSYVRWLGLDAARIGVIHNSVDFSSLSLPDIAAVASYRKEIGLPAEAPVVGTIFRFGPEKRPMLWLEIAASVAKRRPDVHFLMLGDGPLLEETRAAAERMGLGACVHFPGRSTTPAHAFAVMDVFLLTSVLEGLPNVILEAGAMGVPVVSTDVGGVSEALEHGRTGYAIASDDPGQLGDKVVEVLADDDWRVSVAACAPGWVRKRFHVDRMIQETLSTFGMPMQR